MVSRPRGERGPFLVGSQALGAQTGHVGSIAHVYINEAMLHCYRRDFPALRTVIAEIGQLTGRTSLAIACRAGPSVRGLVRRKFRPCRAGQGHDPASSQRARGIADAGRLSRLLRNAGRDDGQTGEIAEGLAFCSAAAEAEPAPRYWLAELHRRRASAPAQGGARRRARWKAALRLPPSKTPCRSCSAPMTRWCRWVSRPTRRGAIATGSSGRSGA